MLKRLFVLLLLVLAAISVSTPARASTLSVSLTCYHSISSPDGSYRAFDCYAYASGGSPNYTFQWYHNMHGTWTLTYQETNGGTSQVGHLRCFAPMGGAPTNGGARVVVTDSVGTQVTKEATVYCARDVS